jgi:hypothetical protein
MIQFFIISYEKEKKSQHKPNSKKNCDVSNKKLIHFFIKAVYT